ncbi:MAG: glucose-6-phosphate dehydrogenase [Burkholderiales bacterium]|nr:glucose-6-phosphate dehydrogenase [Burkholderiales bacterium]
MSRILSKTKQVFDMVIFGATGDLARRKLLPAIYNAFIENNFDESSKIYCVGRQEISQEEYCQKALEFAQLTKQKIDNDKWAAFTQQIEYIKIEFNNVEEYNKLYELLDINRTSIYYLSTAPEFFNTIISNLAKVNLNHANSRIVLEKPLGHDLQSSEEINNFVAQYFTENQIYRIDHFLGKESVQNLMAIRFGNTLFEALWRRQWVHSVQITVAEDLGVGSRGDFYENTGALRDMLQNHLLQLLCIVAMEPPSSLDADIIRDEKLKVLRSLKPLNEEDVINNVIRGQYKAGTINGESVKAYIDEEHVLEDSHTETFVALKAEIQNWRWAGVPFYLRTGKRMQEKVAEIVIQFKDIPCKIFPTSGQNVGNRLIIRIQPEETVQLFFSAKEPGDGNRLKPVYLDLDFNKMFTNSRRTDGYERLLLDVIRGNLSLFVRRDEQLAAWKWVMPILESWDNLKIIPRQYAAGTWGPGGSSALLAKDGVFWHEDIS